MKRILSPVLALFLPLLLLPMLAACAPMPTGVDAPAVTNAPAETPAVPKHPYAVPAVAEGETLLWYGGGWYYPHCVTQFRIVGFPDAYLSHTDKTYTFDDGPDGTETVCFGAVLTGKAPLDSGTIVLLSSEGTPVDAPESLCAVVYDVRVDDDLCVTLGEPRPYTATLTFQRAADVETYPMQARSVYASEGGGFHLSDSITDGTPYYQAGVLYDTSLLAMETGGHYDPGADSEAAGGGATYYRWEFMPLRPGESDILLLTGNYGGELTGVLVHVTVDEALGWSLDWYAEGLAGEAFTLLVTVDGDRYPLA